MTIVLNGTTGITDADGGTVLNTNDLASQAQAQAGTDNTTLMTPLRTANAALGVGQTWQVVTRTSGTAYQNTTGKPIMVAVRDLVSPGNLGTLTITVSPDNVTYTTIASILHSDGSAMSFIVPQSYYYKITGSTLAVTELR